MVRTRKQKHLHALCLLASLLLYFSYPVYAQDVDSSSNRGILYLSVDDLIQSPSELKGEWAFFWKELRPPSRFELTDSNTYISLTTHWERLKPMINGIEGSGYATYQMEVQFDRLPPPVGLSIPDFYTAYQLWINGDEVAHNGVVGTTAETMTPHWLPQTVIYQPDTTTLQLTLQISNFFHAKGGATEPIYIGEAKQMMRSRERNIMLTFVLFGSYFICSLFVIGLFLFGQSDRAAVYFALFCLMQCYRFVGSEDYALHHIFPNLSWHFTLKLEYLSLYFSIAFFWKYGRIALYPYVHYWPTQIAFGTCMIMSTIIFLSPSTIYSSMVPVGMILLVASLGYGLYAIIQTMRKNIDGNIYALIGFIAICFFSIAAVGDNWGWWHTDFWLMLLGYVTFLGFQTLHLSQSFASDFRKAVQNANQANQAKSNFLARMSHEIRTPMNGVLGMASLLGQTKLNEEQQNYVNIIQGSGANLLAIINDILDLSKIEADRMELQVVPFNLPATISEVVSLLEPKAQGKGIKLETLIDPNLPTHIKGDVVRVRQILINILGNAIKFTSEGKVDLKVFKEKLEGNSLTLKITIQDTGIGISKEQLEQIFNPFIQADKSIHQKFGGTGLGLAITKKLVDMMDGSIEVDSKVSLGTTFKLYLPFQIDQLQAEEIEVQISQTFPDPGLAEKFPVNILVAEDHVINQQLVKAILSKNGFTPTFVPNGLEALETMKKTPHDLIFMDIQMPVMDGMASTRAIRKEIPTSDQPIIIALTANAFEDEKQNCIANGMDDYLSKPIEKGALERMIVKWGKQLKVKSLQ